MPRNLDWVVRQIVRHAQRLPDGSGLFLGPPRRYMEIPGQSTSSGPKYRDLRDHYGLISLQRGRWVVPPQIMSLFGDPDGS